MGHHKECIKDGIMRHPAASRVRKHFDELHIHFARERRNVRLGLMSDGFQLLFNASTPYSIRPIILIPCNVAPWDFVSPNSPSEAMDV